MTTRHQLDTYLAQTRRRLQWVAATQSAAALAAALLLVTLLAAVALGRFAFADGVVLAARLLLVAAVLGSGAWYLLRLRALRRDGGARELETVLPAQGGRVTTYLQESAKQPGRASVLLDLLAEDAQRVAEQEPIERAIPARRLWLPAFGAVVGVAALIGTMQFGGLLGEAAQRLWLGRVPPATSIAAAAGGIAVRPGDTTVRRNQDLDISALVARGGSEVTVHVQFDSGGEWETAAMEPDAEGGYAFTLFAVREAARYYVTAGSVRSQEHRIEVVDLPQIESMRLTYAYPKWTGLEERIEESGGDIRAVTGTRVALEVVTDKPLDGPLLIINGTEDGLSQSGVTSRGNIAVKEAGHYRIATRFGEEIVPLTEDFVIDIVVDEKPTVEILRPGRDYRATNIEEVPVSVRARDDFRLESLALQYSVNGGEWRSERLPAGSTDIQAAALLRLEEMQQPGPGGESPLLQPGDLVSYYALARDNSNSTQTDLFLIQVQPFERRFTQSQAGGGGGGGGGGEGEEEEGQIAQRQREVLLATWNLARTSDATGERDKERNADSARMLAEVQQTLADQARTLVERARARLLTGQDENVANFVKSLEEAAKAMVPAAQSLNEQALQVAIQHEQKALQHLLRAEDSFRDIQVAMNSGGGGGGGGAQAGRDVSEMTELELDLEKNQYETEPQMSARQSAQVENDAMSKLRELARRQEQLAREAERRSTPIEAQRWQQEQLRREAEQLRQQLEQMAQQRSQQQQQGGAPSSGQQSGQSGQQSGSQQANNAQRGQQGAQQPRQPAGASPAAEAERQVAQALEQMERAEAQGDRAAAQRAGQQLAQASEQLDRSRQQQEQQRFENLTERARDLAERQAESERELRAAIGNRPPPSLATNPRPASEGGMSFAQMDRLASEKRALQTELESLRAEIDTARRETQQQSPRASEQLNEAAQDLQRSGIAGSLSRNARDIERGRAVEAATREGFIGEALERLQQQLGEAAAVAANESGRAGQQGREADAGDLLAELGELRNALERARQQGLAQSQRGGEPGASSPNAREGQAGQDGGRSGQQGQGGESQSAQGQSGQGGNQPGQQGGAGAEANGGAGDFGREGSGMGGGGAQSGRMVGGVRSGREAIAPGPAEREALRAQTQMSAQRLQQLRQQLQNGTLGEADVRALGELSQRLRRDGADPMAAEYQRMVALVNQLELAALAAQQLKSEENPTRSAESVDDSRRYRDNVAEYYRRLGAQNDR